MCKSIDPVVGPVSAATLPGMAKLDFADYLQHIRDESRRFREVLASCDPAAPVPSCPDWACGRPALAPRRGPVVLGPHGPDPARRPRRARRGSGPPRLVRGPAGGLRRVLRGLVAALEGADPAETAWTWSTEQTVGFIFRRQAHEALIHRLDAELTAGHGHPAGPARWRPTGWRRPRRDVRRAARRGASSPPLPHHVRVDITDTGERCGSRSAASPAPTPRTTSTTTRTTSTSSTTPASSPTPSSTGRPAPLDAWLWRRGDDSQIRVAGDRRGLRPLPGGGEPPDHLTPELDRPRGPAPTSSGSLDGAGALGGQRHRGVAGGAGLLLGEGAVRRPEAQREGQRLVARRPTWSPV